MDSGDLANKLLGTHQEVGDSSTEASSDQDVCLTPRTAATDLTQYDNHAGILDERGTAVIDKCPDRIGLPLDNNDQEAGGASVHDSSGQYGGTEATGHQSGTSQELEEAG